MKPRVVIAIRVSSEDQKNKGFGHDNQLRRLPEIVADNNWEIATRPDGSAAIYDEGAASTTKKAGDATSFASRPEMMRLLNELSDTQPTYLVCRAVDRLHRSRLEWEIILEQLEAAKVAGVVECPDLKGSIRIMRLGDIRDETMAAFEAAFAEYQKKELKEKLMAGRHERARQGLPNGGPAPYGYRRGPDQGPFVINEAEREVYLEMVEMALEGHGPGYICNRLNKRGVKNRSGVAAWSATTVKRILESEAQKGLIRAKFDGKDAWVTAKDQPPLISSEGWDKMSAILASRSVGPGATNKRKHALAGLLRCSACGKTLKAVTNRPTRNGKKFAYRHYTCKVYNSGCSAGLTISEPKALAELAALVNARLAATEDWATIEPVDVSIEDVEDTLDESRRAVERATNSLGRAQNLYIEADEVDLDLAMSQVHVRKAELELAKTEYEAANRAYAAAQVKRPQDVLDMEELRELLADWESFPSNEKREVLETVIDHAILMPTGRDRRLKIVWR